MENKKLIMFDFDGVLVDTLGIAYSINIEAAADLTLPQYKALFNGNITEAFLKEDAPKGHPNFHERYAEETREIVVPEDIKKLVRDLAEKYTLSIVSGSRSSSISEILEREGLAVYFPDVLGYDVDTSKVVRIKNLLSQYGASPKDALFITDTAGDVYEATEAKVASVAVTWGYQEKEMLEKAQPMAFASTVEELRTAIDRFFSATI